MKKVFVATGQSEINKAISTFEDYVVVGACNNRDLLLSQLKMIKNIDILIVGDALRGETNNSLTSILVEIKTTYPTIRVVYLTKFDRSNEVKLASYGLLIDAGLYDIIYGKTLNYEELKKALDIQKTPEDKDIKRLKKMVDSLKEEDADSGIIFEIPEEVEKEEILDSSYQNMAVISSIKPGTGKSFVSGNVAPAIARYGIDTPDGKRPRVALLDADMQNLSIGTFLQIEDDKKNLKTVLQKIDSIMDKHGNLIATEDKIKYINEDILDCFIPFDKQKNLLALTGSQLSFEEVSEFGANHFAYLFDLVANSFDVVVIDSNSSLAHSSTMAGLTRAKTCFYIMNLDFNNVRNNVRYKQTLKDIKISHKVKYILNEDVTGVDSGPEKLKFTVDELEEFDFAGRIPIIPKTVFLNRLYDGLPIVLDTMEYTEKARNEILKIANHIYPIKGFDEDNKNNDKKEKGRFLGIF